MSTQTLRAGSLAFLDTFAGLVPVKVRAVRLEPHCPCCPPRIVADVRVTAARPGWPRGEYETVSVRDLVTRATRVRGGHIMVRSFDATEVAS